jgi:hypothetical protein
LFSLITETTIPIEPKHIGMYNAPNFLNIDMATNSLHFSHERIRSSGLHPNRQRGPSR